MEEIIEFRCKATKDTVTVFGAGKFGEEKLVLDKTKASLLFIELWKFLEFDMSPTYTEEEVREMCYSAMKDRNYTPYNVFVEWLEENKKK